MTEFTADGIDRTTTLKVSGLTCGHCVAHVTEELEALDGVKDVSVLLNKGGQSTVTVLSDIRLDDAALAEAIDQPQRLHERMDQLLGTSWDLELDVFRGASEAGPVTWLHRVG